MCNFLNLFSRVRVEPFSGPFLLSEEIPHCSDACVCNVWACWQGACGWCSCGRGDESSTPCWQLLSHSSVSSKERVPVRPHKVRCLSWQLQIRAPMLDRWQGRGGGTWSFLQFPGMMVTSAYVENGYVGKAESASIAGLGVHQWQCQLHLLRCRGVLQPWIVLAQGFAGLSRELGSDVCFHQTDFYLQVTIRPRLNLQLTVPVVQVLILFVNSLKSVWKMRTMMR